MKVGIVGGGQLARMMALAGYPLGIEFLVLDPNERASAAPVAPLLPGNFSDVARLQALADSTHVMTFDLENVPASALRSLTGATPLHPPVDALATCQDRLEEKRLFDALGIPTPRYQAVNELDELLGAVEDIGVPAVLKTRRLGYDGRGQRVLRGREDVEPAWQALRGVPLILEQFIPFEKEVSIIGVRGRDGRQLSWPVTENRHHRGILMRSTAPVEDPALGTIARDYLTRVTGRFDYVGVLTIEFFVHDGRLIANEMAPRVHNSGHWTIEGAETSQFENHLRAVLGWPLGSVEAIGASAMINFIGTMPEPEALLDLDGVHVHAYGKSARPGRKLGHCTVTGATTAARDARLARLEQRLRELQYTLPED